MSERAGIGVDRFGGPVVDPTANVIALVEANAKATSALREADVKFNDAASAHLKELSAIRAEHAKETRAFDSDRYEKIRAVDMANAAATATQILQAVNTNASVAQQTALTLAKQVTDTAAAQETRQSARDADTAKRLSAVELSMSKGEGKQQVADPAMERLANVVEQLVRTSQLSAGKGEGMSETWKTVLAIGGLLLAFLAYQSRAQVAQPQFMSVPVQPLIPK